MEVSQQNFNRREKCPTLKYFWVVPELHKISFLQVGLLRAFNMPVKVGDQ